ncbi:cytoplasmic protein [Cryptococcus neoformans]|nr:cytoplasmic protein [Cryptococcus neoformans var. grubii]OXH54343.1 cytoplasmic protein [Cryptococcus neoformans var. grubii]
MSPGTCPSAKHSRRTLKSSSPPAPNRPLPSPHSLPIPRHPPRPPRSANTLCPIRLPKPPTVSQDHALSRSPPVSDHPTSIAHGWVR